MESNRNGSGTEIAIIAMTGRFPGAEDIETFWENLRKGRESISTFSDEELADAGISEEHFRDTRYVRSHGVLKDVELFDTDFFDIPPKEAEIIDPQHRLFLLESVRAIELAGYNPDTFQGKISVYAGVSTNTYLYKNLYPNIKPATPAEELEVMIGNDKDFLATRVAYKLNFKGSSYSIQTACSSSLVAVHEAYQGLIRGECDIALAGGVTVKLPQVTGYLYEKGKMHSADGKVRAFDAEASGIVLGNGLGIVVLKPLEKALLDRDTIHAVIKGTATNNDGAYKASYASLGKEGLVRVVREAQAHAGVTPESITYLEMHGTGTNLGDAVEVSAITEAFRLGTPQKQFCGIGSVKTNIGHLDAASGVAGLIKTVLMLKNQALVPSLNYKTPNHNIDFGRSPFYVVTEPAKWESGTTPRRAGVSSFGIGGTNAHIIVEEAPQLPEEKDTRKRQILTLSAKSAEALNRATQNLHTYLTDHPETSLSDLCYTLNIGRREFAHRRALVCGDVGELLGALKDGCPDADQTTVLRRKNRTLSFLLPSLVKAYTDQGLILYLEEPDFREHVDQCAQQIKQIAGFDPLPVFYPGWEELKAEEEQSLPETALFVFQFALAKLWMSWGLQPALLVGYGVGEIVAVCLSGALGMEDTLSLALARDGIGDIKEICTKFTPGNPRIPLLSGITGKALSAAELKDSQYWSRQSAEEGKQGTGLVDLVRESQFVLLEIGPDDALTRQVREMADDPEIDAFASYDVSKMPDLRLDHLLGTLGRLWLCGFKIDWPRYYIDELRGRIPLPTYPLKGRRVWLEGGSTYTGISDRPLSPKNAHPQVEANCADLPGIIAEEGQQSPVLAGWEFTLPGANGESHSPPQEFSTQKKAQLFVQQLIADQLEELVDAIDLQIGFFEQGLSSYQLLWAISEINRKISRDFLPSVFFDCATLAELAAHLEENYPGELAQLIVTKRTERSEICVSAIPANPSERYEPFPLSDIQESFLTGRKLRAGGSVGCHIYHEIDLEELDIYRLNVAWKRLLDHHEMLRAVILPTGQQKILPDTPAYEFKVIDLRRKSESERAAYLQNLRVRMSHKVYAPDQWPLFEVCVTLSPYKKRIHLSIDEFIVDAASLQMLLQQWYRVYDQIDLTLPEIPISFRDYILYTRTFEHSEQYQRDLNYWLLKLENLPSVPLLPLNSGATNRDETNFQTRLEDRLVAEEWQNLKHRLEKLNLSPTAFVLTVFTEVLHAWNERETFSLIMTFFNRLLHPHLNRTMGPFFSTNIFVAEATESLNLLQLAEKIQKNIYEDLGHSSISGVRVLRELKAKRKVTRSLSIPVVFTSLLGNTGPYAEKSFFRHISFTVTQTPQVSLDHQVFEFEGELRYSWDVARDDFAPGLIDEIFSDYSRALQQLAVDPELWQNDAWRSAGITRSTPAAEPTIDPAGAPVAPSVLEDFRLESFPHRRNTPLPLTDQQQAYLFGRSKFASGVSSQLYYDFETEDLDVDRLEKAWQKVMTVHEMLTAVIHRNGTQQLPETAPAYEIKVNDLSGMEEAAKRWELNRIETAMVTRLCPLSEWPYFELQVSRLTRSIFRIHFSIDLIIADALSIERIHETLFYFYENPAKTPEKQEITFADYLLSQKNYQQTDSYQLDFSYWKNKFADIPSGPVLPVFEGVKTCATKRLEAVLTDWNVLREKAAALSVSPGMILLTVYAEVLAGWSESDSFSIVIPAWKRLPFGKVIDQLVGDFTAMSWLVVRRDGKTFEEKVCANHRAVQEDLAHRAVSGLRALRMVAMKSRKKQSLAFPVVFTDLKYSSGLSLPKGFRNGKSLSQTPQVHLDNISEEDKAQLHLSWDVTKGRFPEGMIEEMFAGYRRVLALLADDTQSWQVRDLDQVILPSPEKYGAIVSLPCPSNPADIITAGTSNMN